MMSLGLSYLINQGTISNELVLRYLTGHPVSEVTIGMFFIGVASLGLIAKNIFEQFGTERKITLRTDADLMEEASTTSSSDAEEGSQASDRAIDLGKRLHDLPHWMQDHYLWQRLINALHAIHRTNSASTVEDELKYLADLDLDRQQQRYSLVRILIWATPMLGFLGTVLGISQALGGINVGPDNNFQQMMDGLRGSLYVAFDTTALALTLSIILMFGQFLIERFESQLLVLVDQRAKTEMASQFDVTVAEKSGFENIASEFLDATRNSAEKQTDIWRKSIRAAENAWASTLTQVNTQVQAGLADALDENVSNLAHYLGEAIERADTAMSHRWEQWQVTLSNNARQMESHHRQLCEQTEWVHELLVGKSDPKNVLRAPVDSPPTAVAPTVVPPTVVPPTVVPPTESQPESKTQELAHDVAPAVDQPKTSNDHPAAVDHRSESTSDAAETASAADVWFNPSKHDPTQRETIRFEQYLQSQPRKNASKPANSVEAEVILPFRPVAGRSVRRVSVNHQSKKSA
jgi:biopolymer transport protein ExbB/TolQ